MIKQNLLQKALNMPLDVIWNTLAVINYSSALENEGIDKAASIICEIDEATLIALDSADKNSV